MSHEIAAKPKRSWRWPWREPTKAERVALRLTQVFAVFHGFALAAGALVRIIAPHPTLPRGLFHVMSFFGAISFAYGISALARWRVSIPLGAAAASCVVVLFHATASRFFHSQQPGDFIGASVSGALILLALIGMREPLVAPRATDARRGS